VLGVQPAKRWGQNFVVDVNTVRRIARLAAVGPDDVVLEVGPGLGSLTLALLETGCRVVAVEIDPVLADALPATVAERLPQAVPRLDVVLSDAAHLVPEQVGQQPTALVANLPYNAAVPIVLNAFHAFPGLTEALVMVQAEVAARMVAAPGSRTYGVPSVKIAWFGEATSAGAVPRTVFWPVPNVDSALVRVLRRPSPATGAARRQVFAVIDAAFSQRRKKLRTSLAGLAGGTGAAESALQRSGVDPSARAEQLTVEQFAAVARALPASGG
jgi:16S rRNA (adenine1518-N6/adenine1519-N6)-dimethyltransferase